MGWASGFQAGTALGRQLVDTYEKGQREREFEKIANTKPEEVQGYTAADGQQLEAIANAKDANGNPYYNLDARPDGSYGLRSNFQVAGSDGAMAQPAEVSVAPRRLTEFMGRRYEGEMSPDQIDAARSRAYADAVSKSDPVLGLRMRRDLKADERADTEFQWRTEDRPLEQRGRALQLSGAERTERQGVRLEDVQKIRDQAAKLGDKDLETMAGQVNLGTMPAIFTGRTDKNKFTFVATDKEGRPLPGKSYELNAAQVRQLATAHLLGQAGFGGESFAELTAASKDIAEHIRGMNADFFKSTTLGNDAAYKSGKLDVDHEELNVKRSLVGAQRAALSRPQFAQLVNEKGEAVLVDQNRLPIKADGTLGLPAGLRLPRTIDPEVAKAKNTALQKWFEENPKATADEAAAAKARIETMFGKSGAGGIDLTGLGIDLGAVGEALRQRGTPKAAAPQAPAAPAAASNTEPRGRAEWQQVQRATELGLQPVGRGGALFGEGELLFEGPDGRRVWASQLK